MRSLTAFLCLTFAVLLFSAGEGFALPPCPEDQNQRFHNCFGTFTWPDGEKYVGEFRDDKKHGQGTYTWPSGQKYVGEYRDSKRHGQGTITYADGRVQEGVWENDTYQGTKEEYEIILKYRAKADALDRCLYEDIDKVVSDATERIVRKKCEQALEELSTKELEEAYTPWYAPATEWWEKIND